MSTTTSPVPGTADGSGFWTSPFNSLLPTYPAPTAAEGGWALAPPADALTSAALRHFGTAPSAAGPLVNGAGADAESALSIAARWLAESAAPLIAGLATDVAGLRAAHDLARRVEAVADHADGHAHGLRARQDRGVIAASLGQLALADVVLFIDADPERVAPGFFAGSGLDQPHPEGASRHFIWLGALPDNPGGHGTAEHVSTGPNDLFDTLAVLSALVGGRRTAGEWPALAGLAERLRAARYAAVVWDGARLPGHGALIVEIIRRIVETLNRTTRATTFALAAPDGKAGAEQVFAWLSGLPPPVRLGGAAPDHDPVRQATGRLLADRAVDTLLWISSFSPESPPPPDTGVRRILLGHPGLAETLTRDGAAPGGGETVFIPTSTPGVGSAGILFRCDGVALPLRPLYADTLPTVAEVLTALSARLPAPSQAGPEADSQEPQP